MMTSWAHPTAAERFLHRRQGLVGGFWRGLQALFTRLAYREGRGYGQPGAARIAKVLPAHALLSAHRKLPIVIAEVFAAYRPADYRGVVDEYLAQPPVGPVARSRSQPDRPDE